MGIKGYGIIAVLLLIAGLVGSTGYYSTQYQKKVGELNTLQTKYEEMEGAFNGCQTSYTFLEHQCGSDIDAISGNLDAAREEAERRAQRANHLTTLINEAKERLDTCQQQVYVADKVVSMAPVDSYEINPTVLESGSAQKLIIEPLEEVSDEFIVRYFSIIIPAAIARMLYGHPHYQEGDK